MNAIDLSNLALGLLGQTTEVQAFTETSKASILCRRFYTQVMEEILSEHPWLCASKIIPLSLVPNDTSTVWEYVYYLPADYIQLVELVDAQGNRYRLNQTTLFEIIGNKIYSSFTSLSIKYVACVIDSTTEPDTIELMTPPLVNATALYLAYKLAGPLVGDAQLGELLYSKYVAALYKAMAFDGASRPQLAPIAEWGVNT